MNSSKNCSSALIHGIRPGISLSKKVILVLSVSAGSLIFQACGSSSEEMQIRESKALADKILNGQSEITTDTIGGTTHNFIRNASLKCKVKDVLAATKNIEDLVALQGGYVSNSDLTSTINYNNTVQVKKDSLLELSYYNTSNQITMRIPTRKLDTVIRKISDMAVFIDYRKLSSDDVKLKLAANKLAEARLLQYSHNIEKKSAPKKTKVDHIITSESTVLEKQTLADEKRIESYDLAEQVNFSTVILELYQEQRINSQIIAKPQSPEPYETPFINKLGTSFVNGFELLKNCILFLVNSWGLLLVLTMVFFLIRKMIRNSKSSEAVLK